MLSGGATFKRMVVREDDDADLDEATRHASILQSKQQITNNVINKRKEQLQRWESSEMNGESTYRRKKARVQFQDSDIFLSACMSGDEEEVEELLAKGADINTATVDGLTALHQSVIDSKPDMVRFLCEKGADVNAQDNEGWTPLHAAACCGNLAIVNDKELALDLADDESCREFLEHDYRSQGVIPEQCRDQELTTMMKDVQHWLRDGEYRDQPHRRTGATALHVAAAKGYTQLLEMLIKAGGNIHARDKDGWTPLHAAAHWGERDSCKILLDHGASVMDINYAGQNVLAVADKEIIEYLENLNKSIDKKSYSAVTANILQERNPKLSHGEHTLTTEHKRELKHRDQINENVALHSLVRLDEKSPCSQSESSSQDQTISRTQVTLSSYAEDRNLSTERSASEPPSLLKTSEEISPSDRHAGPVRPPASAGRSSTFSSPAGLHRSTDMSVPIVDSEKLSECSSSLHNGDQNVSTAVSMSSRTFLQPSQWINRNVQLATRPGNSTASSTSRLLNSTSTEASTSLRKPSEDTTLFPGTCSSIILKSPYVCYI
ncbi:ankyrin repeat protein [Dictyocaulus viviparus]|uniref:Ankyrin repeat protein n=1 Tax=Dictyocaulus viviparus TaxID=29172 RepID=A0A0D8XV47_DICVI|nr:ankyrin repeat protein [Dictyocaulus viviparus]